MKTPNAAAFLAVLFICLCSFLTWAAPSFSTPTIYPNTVPMTDPGQLQLVNPNLVGNAQSAENNLNNAQAYKAAQEGNAAIIEANAQGTLAAAWACEIHPYGPGCAPVTTIGWDGMLAMIVSCLVIALGLFGWVRAWRSA